MPVVFALPPNDFEFSFRDIQRERLRAHCRLIQNDLWVTLKSPSPEIPFEAKFFKDTSPDAYPSACSHTTGRLQQMEWGSSPDWYRRDYHWRAWIPTPMPASWFDIRAGGACEDGQWEPVGNQFAFTSDFKHSVLGDLTSADSILRRLYKRVRETDLWKAPGVPLPRSSPPDVLDGCFADFSAMAQRLVQVQRHFLELLGALQWLMGIDDDIDANLSYVGKDLALDVEDRMIEWDLPRSSGRGVLVDLHRDWREINIPLYIANGVPVHYIWTPDLQDDPRFRSLSPIALEAPCPGELALWAYRSVQPPITTHLADQFLQLRYPMDTPVEDKKSQNKMDAFVVDFEGWKARSVTNAQRQRYLKDLWYVVVAGPSRSRRIFYRNRPRVNYYDAYNYLNAPPEENLAMIREIWKFSCCPPPFYRYAPPLAMEQEVVGQSTIPVEAPTSSLQPLPPTPIFQGDPYLEMSDDEDWDQAPMLRRRALGPNASSSMPTVDHTAQQHAPNSSPGSPTRNRGSPNRMVVDSEHIRDTGQNLSLRGQAHFCSRIPIDKDQASGPPNRPASSRRPYHRDQTPSPPRPMTYKCRNSDAPSRTESPRHQHRRDSDFPRASGTAQHGSYHRHSSSGDRWRTRGRDSGRRGYSGGSTNRHSDNGWVNRTQSCNWAVLPRDAISRGRRSANESVTAGWAVVEAQGEKHMGNWGDATAWDDQRNLVQRRSTGWTVAGDAGDRGWGDNHVGNWGDATAWDDQRNLVQRRSTGWTVAGDAGDRGWGDNRVGNWGDATAWDDQRNLVQRRSTGWTVASDAGGRGWGDNRMGNWGDATAWDDQRNLVQRRSTGWTVASDTGGKGWGDDCGESSRGDIDSNTSLPASSQSESDKPPRNFG
jgi:hypothetical protein